jgi:hypothetical protein
MKRREARIKLPPPAAAAVGSAPSCLVPDPAPAAPPAARATER